MKPKNDDCTVKMNPYTVIAFHLYVLTDFEGKWVRLNLSFTHI
jgi:hypothetical protein